jgi:hypothetical protein
MLCMLFVSPLTEETGGKGYSGRIWRTRVCASNLLNPEVPPLHSLAPTQRDGDWRLDLCSGGRMAFDLDLKCELCERHASCRAQPNP